MCNQRWTRDYFKLIIIEAIKNASVLTKLNALKVIASYMIPERISELEFREKLQGGMYERKSMEEKNLCKDMVEEGMRGRASRIISARKSLLENCNEFPNEIINVIICLVFGMSSRSV